VALNGLPGPYIKYFMTQIGHEGLNAMLVGFPTKAAEAVCTFAYSAGPGIFYFYISTKRTLLTMSQEQNHFCLRVGLKEASFQPEDQKYLAGMLFLNPWELD